KGSFRAEVQRLAQARDWQGGAGLTAAAPDVSKGASQSEVRAPLLSDLARIYRDRLRDLPTGEDCFLKFADVSPAHAEANRFLGQRWRERADWKSLYTLRTKAVEATWDPGQRLEWTREAVAIAREHLHAEDLAIQAWEGLAQLGDAQEEAARA